VTGARAETHHQGSVGMADPVTNPVAEHDAWYGEEVGFDAV
jgi:hypothetical protein